MKKVRYPQLYGAHVKFRLEIRITEKNRENIMNNSSLKQQFMKNPSTTLYY